MGQAQRGLVIHLWLATLSCTAANAQSRLHPFEGICIWDAQESQLPRMPPGSGYRVGETMSVARDDGVLYSASFETVYSDGARLVFHSAFAEDGAFHQAGPKDTPFMERITVLPDGGHHVVSNRGKMTHDGFCHVGPSGLTLTCAGTHVEEDGTSSPFLCLYHRDNHVWPVSMLTHPRGTPQAG